MLLPLLLRLCHLCARLHGRLCTIAITIFQDAILCQPASQPTNQLIPLMRKMREIYAEITRNNITDEMADTLSEQYDYFDKRKRFSRRINACHQFQIDGSILNGNVELIIGNLYICHSLSLSLSGPSYLHLKNGNFYLDCLNLLISSAPPPPYVCVLLNVIIQLRPLIGNFRNRTLSAVDVQISSKSLRISTCKMAMGHELK